MGLKACTAVFGDEGESIVAARLIRKREDLLFGIEALWSGFEATNAGAGSCTCGGPSQRRTDDERRGTTMTALGEAMTARARP